MRSTAAILRSRWVAGGAERYLLDLGTALEPLADVRFVTLHRQPAGETLRMLGREQMAARFEVWPMDAAAIEKRTRGFDLFVNAAGGLLVAGLARRNWLVVFSPGAPQGHYWPVLRRTTTSLLGRVVRSHLGARLVPNAISRRLALYPPRSTRASLATYEKQIAISRYVAEASARRWGTTSDVLYPGVDIGQFTRLEQRSPTILSVGRFARYGNLKQHARLIEAFRPVHTANPCWRLHLAGSVDASVDSQSYIEELRCQASGLPVEFHVNVDLRALRGLYASSAIFWHAAGMGIDPIQDPDRVEQFGIVLVEAMASGLVPLAFDAGGVPEIIQPGRSGFLWSRIEDLVDTTKRLIGDSRLRAEFSREAVARSQDFDSQAFYSTVQKWFNKTSQ